MVAQAPGGTVLALSESGKVGSVAVDTTLIDVAGTNLESVAEVVMGTTKR